jgi:hypothetical protein
VDWISGAFRGTAECTAAQTESERLTGIAERHGTTPGRDGDRLDVPVPTPSACGFPSPQRNHTETVARALANLSRRDDDDGRTAPNHPGGGRAITRATVKLRAPEMQTIRSKRADAFPRLSGVGRRRRASLPLGIGGRRAGCGQPCRPARVGARACSALSRECALRLFEPAVGGLGALPADLLSARRDQPRSELPQALGRRSTLADRQPAESDPTQGERARRIGCIATSPPGLMTAHPGVAEHASMALRKILHRWAITDPMEPEAVSLMRAQITRACDWSPKHGPRRNEPRTHGDD